MEIKFKTTFSKKGISSFFLKGLLFFACILFAGNMNAQTNTISGVVKDGFNEPLIGVSVHLDGTTQGTLTDIDGKYTVSASKGQVLVFSFVGMKTQKITVGNQTVVDVLLQEDAHLLTETVVIGYGTAKKRDLTGSIVSVDAAQIANRPSTNPLASLQGKISGVQVINSGQAGQDPEIRIRGTNSINGYKPLYVVDGLLNDNINFLNPSDIESMEILKDPSSLAIFGVRGANGVIIVTTKKAKTGQTNVNINSSFGFKNVVNRMKLTNAAQFKEMYNEQMANEGAKPFDFDPWTADTDWQDEIFQKGFVTDNNVSISAAGEKNRFYLGVGYAKEEGIIKHEDYGKVTINMSSEYEVFKDAKIGFQFNGARMTPADSKGVLNAIRATPVASPMYEGNNPEYQGYYAKMPLLQQQVGNPLEDIDLRANTNKAVNYRGGGNIYGDVSFLKKFNFRASFSLDYRTDDARKYTPRVDMYDPNIEYANPDNNAIVTNGSGRTRVDQTKINETKVQSDYILTYNDTFGDHNLTATGGFTTYYNQLSKLEAGREGTLDNPIPNNPDKWFVNMGDATSATNASESWETTTVSFLLRGIYNYKSKYLFNASYRRDGTSGFYINDNQWADFYSFGGGWVASEEEFFRSQSFVDYLKVKGSWGSLGNQNTGTPYPAHTLPALDANNHGTTFKNGVYYPGNLPRTLVSRDLGWERTNAWEVGFESQYMKQRMALDVTYYSKTTNDLIATTPGINGVLDNTANVGSVRNNGWELSLGWHDKIGDDWSYGISANLTTINNKVLSLVRDDFSIIKGDKNVAYTKSGYPLSAFWGYKVEGVYQTQEEIDNSPVNKVANVTPGDLKFKDVNGDGIVDQKDRTMIGNPTPDFTYGITLNAGYKGFELSVEMMGVQGNEIYRTWDNYNWSKFNYLKNRVNRWTGPGTSNSEPLLHLGHTVNQENSEYYIEDGSFFRIRNIQLAYSFDRAFLNTIKAQALKVYVNIQNPVTWKNNTGYTPEIGGDAVSFGIDKGTYPLPAVYTFGLNLTF